MERNLVDAWRARSARAVPLPSGKLQFSRSMLIASALASAAFGALCVMFLPTDRHELAANATEVPARFDLVIDDGSVQSGYLTEGQVIESGRHGRIEVALEQSRVDIAPDSRVRFERLGRSELRLSLITGRVEVAFHPERVGEQHMSIETRSARVLVVGTQFSVDADGQGNTKVSVSEGTVQVVPRGQGETRFVRAHEHIEVPIQAPQEREREVSEVIKSRLRGDPDVAAQRERAGAFAEAVEPEATPLEGRVSRRAQRTTAGSAARRQTRGRPRTPASLGSE
jgi:hypothetical protein